MKTKIILYTVWAVTLLAFSSCEEDALVTLNPDAVLEPVSSETDVVLTEDGEGTDVLTISWPEPEYGFAASPTYYIYLDKEGGDFSEGVVVNNGGNVSKTFKSEELNAYLINLDFDPEVESELIVKVEARLATSSSLMSEVISLNATAYTSFLDLSTTWGIVGSGYNNWGQFPDAPFFTTSSPGVIVSYVTLKTGEIKFRENNDWGNNLGDDGANGSLEANGANIAVTAGTYKVTFNTGNNTYTIVPYTWGIVGSAYNNWGATPDFKFEYDDSSNKWRAIVSLLDGEFKIRKNNDWGTNYGDDGADGTLEAGGANMVVTAGKYQITFDEENLTVEIISIPNIWGLVGSAYNNWGATPDAQFTRDWRTDNVWVLNYVTLLNGEFKIRDNNQWATNYGDTGVDGDLDLNGDNIAVTAGVYRISIDFTNATNPTWVMVNYP
ncbi:MAG: SusE domain-containing protein [Cyclobacteriaceae bacterium]